MKILKQLSEASQWQVHERKCNSCSRHCFVDFSLFMELDGENCSRS